MKVVAMVPARQGSQGLPGKNIAHLAGRPLIHYPISAARECKAISTTYLNSDSREYLKIGETAGARPFLRRPALAGKDISMRDVVVDFIQVLAERNECYDAVIVLYPAYPLRSAEHLSMIIRAFCEAGGDKPIIGLKHPTTHPYLCYSRQPDGAITSVLGVDADRYYRRQQYPEIYELTHWACVVPVAAADRINAQCISADTRSFLVPADIPVVNIDTPADLEWAEHLLQTRFAGNSYDC